MSGIDYQREIDTLRAAFAEAEQSRDEARATLAKLRAMLDDRTLLADYDAFELSERLIAFLDAPTRPA